MFRLVVGKHRFEAIEHIDRLVATCCCVRKIVLVVGLPHFRIANDQQPVHGSGHRYVDSIGCTQEAKTLLFVGTRQAQDDDSVLLALVAINSVDFHQCLEPLAPNSLVELLPNQPLLFGIHADDTDQSIILVLEVGKVVQELTAFRNLPEQINDLFCLASVVNADATFALLVIGIAAS